MKDLFDGEVNNMYKPLAEVMRPETLNDFVGQDDVVGEGSSLRQMIEQDTINSMIFWGPPGVGKTTLAKIIAQCTHSVFKQLSAVTSGVKEIKEIIGEANFNQSIGKKTILFVDEIHRFNKAQQDAFLPYVENGHIILIGATTENPSFEVNSALLSRSKVYVLHSLTIDNIIQILKRALEKENTKSTPIVIKEECLKMIADICNGDARNALNTLENILNITPIQNNKKEINKNINSVGRNVEIKILSKKFYKIRCFYMIKMDKNTII